MKRKATVTVERERVLVISEARTVERWCEECEAEVPMVGLAEAAVILGFTERETFRLTETRKIHLMETAEGKSLFCINSILAFSAFAPCQLQENIE